METVKSNLKYLSEAKQKKVLAARKAYEALGTPTVADLKAMICMNLIRDNKITNEDVTLAEKVLGPDVGNLKGKAVRTSQPQVIDNTIEIPKELLRVNKEIEISVDGLTVNTIIFLTSISHDIYYRTAARLASTKADSFISRIDEIVQLYKTGGFSVTTIHADKQLALALDEYTCRHTTISVNYASSGEHVPRAERNNRVIEERIRCNYHQLLYAHLPKILVEYMTMESAKRSTSSLPDMAYRDTIVRV